MSGHKEPKHLANFSRSRAVHLSMTSLKIGVCFALMPLLTSCASLGLYDMSDEWCAKHLDASMARCPGHPAQQDQDRVAANTVNQTQPQ